jgi:hypothetical protein
MTHEERFDRIEEDLRRTADIQLHSAQRFEEERDALWEALGLLTQNVNALTDRLDEKITSLAEQHSRLQTSLQAFIDQLKAQGGNGHASTQ